MSNENQIYIGHLSRDVRQGDLYDYCRKVGPLDMSNVIIKRNYAFVVSPKSGGEGEGGKRGSVH
jgi:RNA recognition motif-containing protein